MASPSLAIGETIITPYIPKRISPQGLPTMFFPTQTLSGTHLEAVKAQILRNMYRQLDEMGLRDDKMSWEEKHHSNQYETLWILQNKDGKKLSTIHVTKPESTWEAFEESLDSWFDQLKTE
jgi:hypothetical protein|tara:strand:+ start:395 stop:757 length:363 start_codon:yes stop_codon:yes gene_type:complete